MLTIFSKFIYIFFCCFCVTFSMKSVATVKSAVVPGLILLDFNFLSKKSSFLVILSIFLKFLTELDGCKLTKKILSSKIP